MLAMILICIALIIMTAPGSWPFSPNTVAFLLAVFALIVVCCNAAGVHVLG
jgi:hypothetical protein